MKHRFIKQLTAAMFIWTICLLPGCGGDAQKPDKAKPAAKSETSSTAKKAEKPVDPEELAIDKWNAYIELTNTMQKKVFEAMDKYAQVIGTGEKFQKPASENNRISFSNSTVDNSGLGKAIDAAIAISAKEPISELDKAASEMAVALKSLWTNMREMSTYLKEKKYIDDDYARANELHIEIVAGMAAYQAALPPYYAALEKREAEIRATELTRMRAEGLTLRPAVLETLLAAEAIGVYLDENDISADAFNRFDLEQFRPLYDEFAKKLNALEELNNEESAKKEGLTVGTVKSFIDSAKATKTSAAGLIEAHQEKKKMDKYSRTSPESYLKSYNTLQDRYNRMVTR